MANSITVAEWSIDANGDVVERLADGPVCIWHTGNRQLAEFLIVERRAMVEHVYMRHLRADLNRKRANTEMTRMDIERVYHGHG